MIRGTQTDVFPSVKIIEDNIAPDGVRLTSVEVRTHRWLLAEWNTHRDFSRNSASSRAIPLETMIRRVMDEPAWPLVWPCEQPGMSGGAELTGQDLVEAQALFGDCWKDIIENIDAYIRRMVAKYPDDPKAHRLHKSLINRLIEPFMWHTMLISSTEWDNFYRQRCSPSAMPEFRIAAEMIRDAIATNEPQPRAWFEWHTPYVGLNVDDDLLGIMDRLKVSVARCARTSYLTHDGIRDVKKDIELYEGTLANYGHWSPLEHVAICLPREWEEAHFGNFGQPWHQLRHFVEHADGHFDRVEKLVRDYR